MTRGPQDTPPDQIWTEDIRTILEQIKKEPVPEEMLRLARKLERALQQRLREKKNPRR